MQSSSSSSAAPSAATPVTWVWDIKQQLYYSPQSGTYAYHDPATGQWHYVSAASLASLSTPRPQPPSRTNSQAAAEREEGEIEDDVGWGGLMEPEELDRALKGKGKAQGQERNQDTLSGYERHPAYGGPAKGNNVTESRGRSPSPTKETPHHLLRLVVLESPSLSVGHVAVIDAREGGVQLGRDRCEKGGHPRVRVKEMEVSKTHAVVYWGQGGDEQTDGWWVVDLGESVYQASSSTTDRQPGSTHGTFMAVQSETADDIDGEPLSDGDTGVTAPHRLSEPKISSLPYPLAHKSVLSLGQTRFEVHLHESWPCEACQLGRGNEVPIDTGEAPGGEAHSTSASQGNGYAMNSQERRENRETKRKREMAALKDSLLNRSSGQTVKEATYDGRNRYIDRSAIRRQMHPRSPPRQRPVTVPDPEAEVVKSKPAPVSTFAQNMMAAQGWAPGSGLGKGQSGRSEAIEVKMRVEKRGLGAHGAEAPPEDVNEDWRKRAKVRRFEEMRGR